ncbi:MAG: carbonic anhydrase, partial [Verrucomicrobia bacterium]|nr:carbonic anhydrase [Cytophagales bacterium]
SAVAFVILIYWGKLAKKYTFFQWLPGSLVAVISGVLLNALFERFFPNLALAQTHLVSLPRINNLSEFGSLILLPDFSQIRNPQVYITAFTIAVVASLETLLNLEATDKIDTLKRRTSPNRELIAQGIGNTVAGLIGGIPVTSVIVRSSVNVDAGAKSKLSTIIHGILLLVSVLFLASVMNLIPLAVLAMVLILTGYKLAKPKFFKEIYALGWTQFLPFITTVVAILFTDLLIGIGIGMVVAIYFILKENFRTAFFFTREVEKEAENIKIDLSEHVSFLNKASIANILNSLPENSSVEIDGTKSSFIDYDVLEVIHDFESTAKTKNITLNFKSRIDDSYQKKIGIFVPEEVHNHDVDYEKLFENNRDWIVEQLQLDPEYFQKLAKGQSPKFLFIGCSDSRVPAERITGTEPGEMFIHRNVANLVVNTDLNFMSVLQYAVEVLKVQHIIVCGHYNCGGVKAAMYHQYNGLIDKWLRNIKDVYRLHRTELNELKDENVRFKRLVELNVQEQVYNLHKTSIIQRVWQNDANVHVHGWVFDLSKGSIVDLKITKEDVLDEYNDIYRIDFGD